MKRSIAVERWCGRRGAALATCCVLAAAVDAEGATAAEWRPEKPVELIATNAPGG